MFSYGQRSKCADLLNSYDNPLFTIILNRYSLFPEKLGGRNAASDRARRENVPRHILFYADSNIWGSIITVHAYVPSNEASTEYVTIYLAIHVHLKV